MAPALACAGEETTGAGAPGMGFPPEGLLPVMAGVAPDPGALDGSGSLAEPGALDELGALD